MQLKIGNLHVDERHRLVTLSFELSTHADRAMAELIAAFNGVIMPHGYDWLLDLRNVTPAVTLFHLERVAHAWEGVAKGRDIGRRTAILYGFRVAPSATSRMRKLFPFRTVRPFDAVEDATKWLESISCDQANETLLV